MNNLINRALEAIENNNISILILVTMRYKTNSFSSYSLFNNGLD